MGRPSRRAEAPGERFLPTGFRIAVMAVGAACGLAFAACGDDSPASTPGGADASLLDTGGADAPGLDGSDAPGEADAEDAGAEVDEAGPDASQEDTPDLPTTPPSTLGGDRPAGVRVPDAWVERTDWPLIILLHGYSANSTLQDLVFRLADRVDTFGFVLLLPEGTQDLTGNQFWNATDACCDVFDSGVDDVGYLTALIDEALERLRIDPNRVYLVGHSNGGFMAHRMACDVADRVTAIAALAGTTYLDSADCQPSDPVSVLQIHGTLDATISYDGGSLTQGSYPGARATALQWRDHNGCESDSTEAASRDYEIAVPGAETEPERWDGCDGGVVVDLWTIQNAGHIPTFNNAFRDDLVEHLLAQVRQ